MKLNHMLARLGLGIYKGGSSARADSPQPPKNVNVEPTTPKSAALTSRAASAEMTGNPQAALKLAERAIATNQRDPWGYYDKAMALAQVGQLDRALEAFGDDEQRHAATGRSGKSAGWTGRSRPSGRPNSGIRRPTAGERPSPSMVEDTRSARRAAAMRRGR